MIDRGKRVLLGIGIDAVDYDAAVDSIVRAARDRRHFGVSALAVHGVMTGALDEQHRFRLNQLELVVPDGQPVRWALNALHGVGLRERVYGPELTLRTCGAAAREGLPVYLYGSTADVLEKFAANLRRRFPGLIVAGAEPSRFRRLTPAESAELVSRVSQSGARIMLVGLGCPRQEVFAYELREQLSMPCLAVGAAFDFHAGTLPQAPAWMQRVGLEWVFRLLHEPRRLWRRYLYLNPTYVAMVALQMLHLRGMDAGRPPLAEERYG